MKLIISIHAPAWGATRQLNRDTQRYSFQSTPPAWGATLIALFITSRFLISIHAPRMGSDGRIDIVTMLQIPFQSTLPAWGATTAPDQIRLCRLHFNPRSPHGERLPYFFISRLLSDISIHAPRMGSDACQGTTGRLVSYFNPRSPHGERLGYEETISPYYIFQSTLPAWGATRRLS